MAPKMTTMFTRIPGVMPYGGADWSNRLPATARSVEEAQALVKTDPAVYFFFRTAGQVDLGPKGNFAAGDMALFTGAPWLGSAPAETWLAASSPGTG